MTSIVEKMTIGREVGAMVHPETVRILSLLSAKNKGCCFPSCTLFYDRIGELDKHHKDFQGEKVDLLISPEGAHVLHPACHRNVHYIACFIIMYVEHFVVVYVDKLIQATKEFLQASEEDIKFVIFEELKPANIIIITKKGKKGRKGKSIRLNLSRKKKRVVRNIKKYIEEREKEKERRVFFDAFNAYLET